MASIDGLTISVPMNALVVVYAVEQLIVLVVERAVDRNRRRLATVVGTGAARQRVWDPLAGARHTLDQTDEVPSVDGHVLNVFSVTSVLTVARVGLDQRRFSGDRDVLGHGADLQLHIDAGAVAGRHRDARALGTESLQLDFHRVGPNR